MCKSSVSEVKEVVVAELAIPCVEDVKLVAATYNKTTCYKEILDPLSSLWTLGLLYLFYRRKSTDSILQIVHSLHLE